MNNAGGHSGGQPAGYPSVQSSGTDAQGASSPYSVGGGGGGGGQQRPPPAYDSVTGGGNGMPSTSTTGVPFTWQGTPVMGVPAPPNSHPANQHVAGGGRGTDVPQKWNNQPMQIQPLPTLPYLHTSPGTRRGTVDSVISTLGKWAKKAEVVATDVYKHLSTSGSTVSVALNKMEAKTRTLVAGGQESYWRSTFQFPPGEQLKKTFNGYLSTATGPVAGVIYVSPNFLSFCSDKPLPYAPASGQEAWTYYKVVLPFQRVATVIPSSNPRNAQEKYIEITTIDSSQFWFLGLMHFEKCMEAVQEAVAIAQSSAGT